jgi:hypothetical protein
VRRARELVRDRIWELGVERDVAADAAGALVHGGEPSARRRLGARVSARRTPAAEGSAIGARPRVPPTFGDGGWACDVLGQLSCDVCGDSSKDVMWGSERSGMAL